MKRWLERRRIRVHRDFCSTRWLNCETNQHFNCNYVNRYNDGRTFLQDERKSEINNLFGTNNRIFDFDSKKLLTFEWYTEWILVNE